MHMMQVIIGWYWWPMVCGCLLKQIKKHKEKNAKDSKEHVIIVEIVVLLTSHGVAVSGESLVMVATDHW